MEKRVKFIRFSKDTVKRLFQYINTERKENDPNNLGFDDLPDEAPIFLTESGTPLTYHAWYYHWDKAMKNSDLKVNPHKARHWFVTTRVREIYNVSNSDSEIEQRKNELIKYMKWKNTETIKVYEHYFDEEKHREAHDQILENMALQEKEYMKQKKKKRKKPNLTVIETNYDDIEIDDEIQELLDGLE